MTKGVARKPSKLTRRNLGFLLAKASQYWNERLHALFSEEGYADVRPSFGAILVPLFEEDGLRLGELANRAKLSKQTMTTMVRLVEKSGYVKTRPDSEDARATRVYLTTRARDFRPCAERALAQLEGEARKALGSERYDAIETGLAHFAKL
jgi:DNA-binding MarR family transcriptional regulator